jgi:hypothetical protein
VDYQHKMADLKAWAKKLDETIVDKGANEFFLRIPKLWLDDVERKMLPGFEYILPVIEQHLARAQDAVNKYGPNLRIVG